jgi:hypothetical protein
MRYVPFHELKELPNIIVDGSGNKHTVLMLSHWPHSGTPQEFKDDLSAQIVFRYLDRPDLQVSVEAVSNNHFDEDGLVSLYGILNPEQAQGQRNLLIDIAAAGDFGTYKFREAARIAFTIEAWTNPETSPLNSTIFNQSYPDITANLYRELLLKLPEIIANTDAFQIYWDPQDAELQKSEEAVEKGIIQIEEIPALDLAIITLPENFSTLHPMALHNGISCFCLLLIQGRKYELRYRYETWIQYVSQRLIPRVDFKPLAEQLTQQENGETYWQFDGVEKIIPRLHLIGVAESQISPDSFRRQITDFLMVAPPAWNPFD